MKTAMQELKEEIQSKVFQPTNLTDYQYGHNVAYGVVLTIVEYLLEKEKEQISFAFDEGGEVFAEDGHCVKGIEHYNQTYNN